MGTYTRMTRAWLDQRYRRTTPGGVYVAHQPIYGLGSACSEPGQVPRMARTFQILKVLNRLEFSTFLDVGAAEGHLAQLVREAFGADVMIGDLSAEAARRAFELFGLAGVGLDSSHLPFPDDSFDVVCCSEVIEHVEFPVAVLTELERVARLAVLVTTEEATGDPVRLAAHAAERRDLPHAERNLFDVEDFRVVFGDGVELRSEYRGTPPTEPVVEATARAWIRTATDVDGWSEEGLGVLALALKPAGRRVRPRVDEERLLVAATTAVRAELPLEEADATALVAADRRLVCPRCRASLETSEDGLACTRCERSYALRRGVPALYDERAPDVTAAELETRIAVRWNDRGRVVAALELHERLLLPDATRELDWDFSNAADREAWTVGHELEPRASEPFCFRATGSDPWLVGPMCVLPDGGADVLEVELRIHNPDFPIDAGAGQLFWMGAGDLSFEEASSVTFPLVNDGVLRTYRVPAGEHARWPRSGALWLRLDPANGPCELDLVALRLVSADAVHGPEEERT